jgi:hypothetical protein
MQLVLLKSNKITCLVLPLISCCLFLPELILCGLFSKCQNRFLKKYPRYVVERSSSKMDGKLFDTSFFVWLWSVVAYLSM